MLLRDIWLFAASLLSVRSLGLANAGTVCDYGPPEDGLTVLADQCAAYDLMGPEELKNITPLADSVRRQTTGEFDSDSHDSGHEPCFASSWKIYQYQVLLNGVEEPTLFVSKPRNIFTLELFLAHLSLHDLQQKFPDHKMITVHIQVGRFVTRMSGRGKVSRDIHQHYITNIVLAADSNQLCSNRTLEGMSYVDQPATGSMRWVMENQVRLTLAAALLIMGVVGFCFAWRCSGNVEQRQKAFSFPPANPDLKKIQDVLASLTPEDMEKLTGEQRELIKCHICMQLVGDLIDDDEPSMWQRFCATLLCQKIYSVGPSPVHFIVNRNLTYHASCLNRWFKVKGQVHNPHQPGVVNPSLESTSDFYAQLGSMFPGKCV